MTSYFRTRQPKRNTNLRLWTKLDVAKNWKQNFKEKELTAIILNAAVLTTKHLGFDISQKEEHLGNVYLCACNPLLRTNQSSLSQDNELLVVFKERLGKSVTGCKLILEEKRGDNLGFTIEKIIEDKFTCVKLPYFPNLLHTSIYDTKNQLIDRNSAVFLSKITINSHFQHTELQINIKSDTGVETIKVPKYSDEKPAIKIGYRDHSNASYFISHTNARSFLKLEKNKVFIFFPGSDEDKIRAKIIIHELLNNATERCMILDPYFGALDIGYTFVVANLNVPVQIISSGSFLSKKVNKNENAPTNARELLNVMTEFKKQYSAQVIECRVLKGNHRSPLHDRYIVVDDNAYILGSSFNEFGTRATTLAKVPAPIPMINQALEWWKGMDKTISLNDFVNLQK